jgi:AcrR family transcriptional regulator
VPETTHGQRRRLQILAAAADLSTAEGLESLSFGRIASEVGLTKPGVAAHFASKQDLQLAVVEAAAAAYEAPLTAAEAAQPGLRRLRALAMAWLDHLDGIDFRSGCFFAAAGSDFSGRPGPVRDAIAHCTRRLLRALEEQARLAERLGELRGDVTPEALAFTLHGLAQEANLRRELLDEDTAFEAARRALDELLCRAASQPPSSTPENQQETRP